jgi:hypothetical protein
MGVAAKLSGAAAAAIKGATSVADALTKSAASDAARLTTTPQGAASLLAAANAKRLGAERIAAKAPPPRAAPFPVFPRAQKPKPKAVARPAPKPAYAPRSEAALLASARAGRVKSNVNQTVSDSQLLAAHRAGRVFWVQ